MTLWASQVALVVKSPPVSAGGIRDAASVPEPGRSPGAGDGNPLQYSCLGSPTDRGVWWATVHSIAESDITERLSTAQHLLTPGASSSPHKADAPTPAAVDGGCSWPTAATLLWRQSLLGRCCRTQRRWVITPPWPSPPLPSHPR